MAEHHRQDRSETRFGAGSSLYLLAVAFLFLVGSEFAFTLPLRLVELAGVDAATGGNAAVRGAWALAYLLSAGLLWRVGRLRFGLAARAGLVGLLIALAVLSLFWSLDPVLTLRRSAALIGTLLMAFVLADLRADRFLWLLIGVMGLAGLASAATAVMLPELGIAIHSNTPGNWAWQGAYLNRNTFGRFMALGALAAILLALARPRWAILLLPLAAGFIAAVLLSKSATSLVAVAVTTGVILGVLLLRLLPPGLRMRAMIIALLPLAAVAALVFLNLQDIIVEMLGRSSDLTGRLRIWELLLETARERVLVGHGYEVFWRSRSSVDETFLRNFTWALDHAHNSFFEIYLDLGLVGLALLVLVVLFGVMRALGAALEGPDLTAALPLMLLTLLLLFSVTETVMLRQNNLFSVLFLVAIIAARDASRGETARRSRSRARSESEAAA